MWMLNKRRRRLGSLLVASSVSAAILAAMLWLGVGTPVLSQPRAPQPTPPANMFGFDQSQISQFPPEKRARIEEAQRLAQQNRGSPPPKNPATLLPSSALTLTPAGQITKPQRPAGGGTIVESQQAPLPGQLFSIANYWYTTQGSQVTQVFAGADRRDPTQGVVVVIIPGNGQPAPPYQVYRTPTKSGSVRVVDAQGQRLTLRTDSGITITFDVLARQFTSP